ncbi:MAG TPA: hypothetical protein VEH80_07975 [Candidatus Bathyarchaeia archaeon]|nr:hypothetical protein [Candidatus Bathyarchaeia archaeon]
MADDVAAYAQPTPRLLYVHDDLTGELGGREAADPTAARLARELLAAVATEPERVRVLTLDEQLDRVIAQGDHPPFAVAIGIDAAGRRVAQALHARTGWFPCVRSIGLTREEDGRGGYRLASPDGRGPAGQLRDLTAVGPVAVVDDTVFSGLTMRAVIEALPAPARARVHAFCLRGVAESIATVAALCPITAGVTAPGRRLEDVSFINASGLVRRIAIRRAGRAPLAFFDRPEWIRAWFPSSHSRVLALCRELNARLEPPPS